MKKSIKKESKKVEIPIFPKEILESKGFQVYGKYLFKDGNKIGECKNHALAKDAINKMKFVQIHG